LWIKHDHADYASKPYTIVIAPSEANYKSCSLTNLVMAKKILPSLVQITPAACPKEHSDLSWNLHWSSDTSFPLHETLTKGHWLLTFPNLDLMV